MKNLLFGTSKKQLNKINDRVDVIFINISFKYFFMLFFLKKVANGKRL